MKQSAHVYFSSLDWLKFLQRTMGHQMSKLKLLFKQ